MSDTSFGISDWIVGISGKSLEALRAELATLKQERDGAIGGHEHAKEVCGMLRDENAQLRAKLAFNRVLWNDLSQAPFTMDAFKYWKNQAKLALKAIDAAEQRKCGLCTDIKPCNWAGCPDDINSAEDRK